MSVREGGRRPTSEGRSLYAVLGVERDATENEIRHAYRKMALKHHPDKNPDDPEAEERFKVINHAYSILSDERKRRIYDEHGSEGLEIAETYGAENVNLFYTVNSPVTTAIVLCIGLLTCCFGCCFCCCFCCFGFCCGACAPKEGGSESGGRGRGKKKKKTKTKKRRQKSK